MARGKRMSKWFKASDLESVAKASEFRFAFEPGLGIGDIVMLNSGGPALMVVDLDHENITAAWRDGEKVTEMTLPAPCFHRIDLTRWTA